MMLIAASDTPVTFQIPVWVPTIRRFEPSMGTEAKSDRVNPSLPLNSPSSHANNSSRNFLSSATESTTRSLERWFRTNSRACPPLLTVTLTVMFTGIVEELGTVVSSADVSTEWGPGVRLTIAASTVLEGSGLGASIAVNGCCLTLVGQGETDGRTWWETDVSQETLDRTTVGSLAAGDRVNLERPMALGDRLGGHMVLGHVDGVGEVVSAAPDLVVRVPSHLMKYLVEKGSVTVDGISLTAFDITTDTFRVAVIPHTAEVTTLGYRPAGSRVNLEMDVLAKHIERLVEPHRK